MLSEQHTVYTEYMITNENSNNTKQKIDEIFKVSAAVCIDNKANN